MRKNYIFLLIVFIFSCKETPELEKIEAQAEYMVTATTLRVRKIPNQQGAIIGFFKRGRIIKEFDRTQKKAIINNHAAYWILTETDTGQRGWVFGGYLKPLRESAYALMKKAIKLERQHPEEAKKYYNLLKEKFANQKIEPLHDLTYGDEADRRSYILECRKERSGYQFENSEQAGEAIRAALKTKTKGALIDLADCDFHAGICNSDNVSFMKPEDFMPKLEIVWRRAKLHQFRFDHSEPRQSYMFIKAKGGFEYGFWLWKVKNKWLWSGFCATNESFFN